MSDWQPIETAPTDGTEFLAYDPVAGKFDVCRGERLGFIRKDIPELGDLAIESTQSDGEYGPDHDRDFLPNRATHWQPLPAPPASQ